MKKIFYLASIAALAFSSCAKDETAEAQIGAVNGGSKITAAMAADDTRTSLDENQKFRWSAGDQLGVYTVGGGLNNAAFVLDNASDGSAVGVFSSQSAKLSADKKYVAVYPRFQEGLFTETIQEVKWDNPADPTPSDNTDDVKYPNYETVKVKIPAKQKYQDASVYTQTVPAVSTTFVVDENGAQVSMQPVVDYLFVNIQSVEPINTLTLTLRKDRNATWIPIAGTGNLSKYILDKEYRYALLNENLTDSATEITLQIDEAAAEVMCHESNTYVFTIPAGILGMGGTVEAGIEVNKGQSNAIKFDAVDPSAINGDKKRVTNEHLNGYKVKENGSWTTKNRKKDGKFVMRQENTVFWMNPLDDKGERTTFTYNPKNTFVIENEGDLLIYLTEYGKNTTMLNGKPAIGKVDALICNEHTFDFSVINIQNLSDRLQKNSPEYTKYEPYYSAYLKGSFPTISGEYTNVFRGMEHNGVVPTIKGIERPLASATGIFGTIGTNGKIENVIFSGIEAAKQTNYTSVGAGIFYGTILGSINGGSLKNVTVEDAHGSSILAAGNVAAYNQLTVSDVDELNFIVNDMNIEKNFEIKNWSVATGVATSVFGTIDAVANDGDSHHVITLPAGADYEDLALYIGTANKVVDGSSFTAQNIIPAVVAGYYPKYHIDVDQDNLEVVSVMIDGVSYWTGDKFPMVSGYYDNAKLLPATYTKDSDKVNDVKVKGWSKIQYAEQLATGAENSSAQAMYNVVLQNKIDLTTSTMPWKAVEVHILEGNGQTVKGINMVEKVASTAGIAPISSAAEIRNLIVDGVAIEVITTGSYKVPQYIAGLTLDTRLITNVTVKNLVIEGAGDGMNNEAYNPAKPVFIGWLVANAQNPVIVGSKVEGVNCAIKGVAGLVGKATLTTGAAIRNSSATITSMAQTALPSFVEAGAVPAGQANYAGTAVGYVQNNSALDSVTFTFEGVGTPVFFFYSKDNTLVASYGGGVTQNLKNATVWDNMLGAYVPKYDYTSAEGTDSWLGI